MLCRASLFPLAVAYLAAQTVPERASVEGQVLNQRTGAPIAGAQVKLLGSGARAHVATDRAGRFTFSSLDAGQYHLLADHAGFVSLTWARFLTLAAGEKVTDLTVRLVPQATISGALLDADGVPAANVNMQLLRHTWRAGKRILSTVSTGQSNDAGEFRIAGLATGDYLLLAQPHELAVPPGEDKIRRIYVATWYPGVTAAGAAGVLHVAAGEEHTGMTFSLRVSTVVRVRGHVVLQAAKSEMDAAMVSLMRADDAMEMDLLAAAQTNGPDGAFVIPDVPPGSYRIQAHWIDGTATPIAARDLTSPAQIIQVGDTNVDGVTLAPAPPRVLTGLVKWDPKAPKDAGACRVWLQGESDALLSDQQRAATLADGAFSLEVPPAHFDLSVYCDAKGSYMKAARLSDADILELGINGADPLPPGPLQVTMALGAGTIDGFVLDADSNPIAGATVGVSPDESKRAALYHSATTDQNGRFQISDVVPGAYSLYAWDQIADDIWRNDDFIKKYDDRRQRVHLDTGGQQTVQLQIIKVE